jgi:hypothetical protein
MKPTRTEPSGRRDALDDWRRRRLMAAGFDAQLAIGLTDGGVDLHELLVLVDRGCPPDLAARILAPLDRPAGS